MNKILKDIGSIPAAFSTFIVSTHAYFYGIWIFEIDGSNSLYFFITRILQMTQILFEGLEYHYEWTCSKRIAIVHFLYS